LNATFVSKADLSKVAGSGANDASLANVLSAPFSPSPNFSVKEVDKADFRSSIDETLAKASIKFSFCSVIRALYKLLLLIGHQLFRKQLLGLQGKALTAICCKLKRDRWESNPPLLRDRELFYPMNYGPNK